MAPQPHFTVTTTIAEGAPAWPLRMVALSAVAAPPPCAACGAAALDLHQPDPTRPRRLLGVCDRCGAWHLIGLVSAAPSPRAAGASPARDANGSPG